MGVVQLVEHQVVILLSRVRVPSLTQAEPPPKMSKDIFGGSFGLCASPPNLPPFHSRVGWRPRQIARSRATRARAERTYLWSLQIDRKPLSLTSG